MADLDRGDERRPRSSRRHRRATSSAGRPRPSSPVSSAATTSSPAGLPAAETAWSSSTSMAAARSPPVGMADMARDGIDIAIQHRPSAHRSTRRRLALASPASSPTSNIAASTGRNSVVDVMASGIDACHGHRSDESRLRRQSGGAIGDAVPLAWDAQGRSSSSVAAIHDFSGAIKTGEYGMTDIIKLGRHFASLAAS